MLVITLATKGYAQSYEVVVNKNISNYESKSYYITSELRLLPGFSFTAQNNQEFFGRFTVLEDQPLLNDNYRKEELIQISGVTQENQIPALSIDEVTTSYHYVDGLGRMDQDITVKGSSAATDLIKIYRYDNSGRSPLDYLVFAHGEDNNGKRVINPVQSQAAYYASPPTGVVSDTRPFKEFVFESSALNRISETFDPGEDWKNGSVIKPNAYRQLLNNNQEVMCWNILTTGLPTRNTANNGFYTTNILSIEQVTDEDNLISRVYSNLLGQQILTRSGDGTNWLDTYYIYDGLGNVIFVIQPEGVSRLDVEYFAPGADKNAFINKWSFQYQYDNEQRVIATRSPGASDWTYQIYDSWGRLVLTQNPDQRERTEYTFFKYDQFNRIIITGVYTSSIQLSTLRTNVQNSTVRFENSPTLTSDYTYTLTFPSSITSANLMSVTYYDNYNFLSVANWDSEGNSFAYTNISDYPQNSEVIPSAKSLVTGSRTRVIDQSKWLNSVTYYNAKYRPVQIVSESNAGGLVRKTCQFDFLGNVIKEVHQYTQASLTVENKYEYDHGGRLVSIKNKVNSQSEVVLVSNQYNEIGQCVDKKLHSINAGQTFLQSIDYKFNIRGWLTQINNSQLSPETDDDHPDVFGMELQYNPDAITNVNNEFTTKRYYSKRVSAITWQVNNQQDESKERIFAFDHDNFGRIKGSHFAIKNLGNWDLDGGMFNEQITEYNKNGDILRLSRYGKVEGAKTEIDNLQYGYSPTNNRLITVDDNSASSLGFKAAPNLSEEYLYNANGAVRFDHNKGISSILYNYLGLVKEIQFTRPNSNIDRIQYIYDATGNKLAKRILINGNLVWETNYVDGVQFDNGLITSVRTAEGRIVNRGNTFDYEYFLKDYQGNTRATIGLTNEVESFRATMESELANSEDVMFSNLAATRSSISTVNFTKSSEKVIAPDRSAVCNAFTGNVTGPGKEIRVLNGDKVFMEVQAQYNQVTGNTATVATAALVSAVTGTFGVTPGENPQLYQSFNTNLGAISGGLNASSVVPKAYLVWVFFDDNFVYVQSGAQAITTVAFNSFERLSRSFTAEQNGHLFIYVTNESNVNASVNVYFDELYIVHEKNNQTLQVFQSSDYYPFGLTFNNYQADRLVESQPGNYQVQVQNRIFYNGKELQRDFEFGEYDFGARLYSPQLGRWSVPDPKSSDYYSLSPYSYALNNPVIYVDPDGRFVATLIGTVVGGIYGGYEAYSFNQNSPDWVHKSVLGGITQGVVTGFITGVALDLAAESGGTSLALLETSIAYGTIGGFIGGVAGSYANQMITNWEKGRKGLDHKAAFENGVASGIAGGIGGMAGAAFNQFAQAASKTSRQLADHYKGMIVIESKLLSNQADDAARAVEKSRQLVYEFSKNANTIETMTEGVMGATYEVLNALRDIQVKTREYEMYKEQAYWKQQEAIKLQRYMEEKAAIEFRMHANGY